MLGNVPSPWKTNVLGILGDGRVLFASILCPALSYYAASELFEDPPAGVVESCVGGYCLCVGFCLRKRLREKYNLDGSVVGDFLAHLCCHCVALARVWREAEVQMEAEKQLPGPNMAPPQQQYMVPGLMPQPQMHPGMQPMPYYGSLPPQVFVGQQGIVMQQARYRPNTVDTNLSEVDSKIEVALEEPASYNRHDSMDPPPSNTDTDPWDMLRLPQGQGKQRRQENERTNRREEKQVKRLDVPYETFVSGEMADITAAENQPTPFSRKVLSSGDADRQLSARLANLRPSSSAPSHPAVGVKKDPNDECDRIIMGSTQLITAISMVKEEVEEAHGSGHDDPPQRTRSGSLPSKRDGQTVAQFKRQPCSVDASFLTYVATVGSEALPRYPTTNSNELKNT